MSCRISARARTGSRRWLLLREQFIALLGHDLRNPIAGIEGGRRMLEKAHSDDPKSKRILRLMEESIARMSGLIDDVMDLARNRLGAGMILNRKFEPPIEQTVSQVIAEIKSGHTDRAIEWKSNHPRAIEVDHARIAQMFSNLLGNAVTHGALDQRIVVESWSDDGEFRLSVANGGEPIPKTAMERLFQPFYRGDVEPGTQGLGLGLYIARQIAEAHGGTIDIESDVHETRFAFRCRSRGMWAAYRPYNRDDVSPGHHPASSRVLWSLEPFGLGGAMGRSAVLPRFSSAPSHCMPEALSLA